MYNCIGRMVLGSSVVVFLGVSIGDETLWEGLITVDLIPDGESVASLGDSNDVRSRVELEGIFNMILLCGVKEQ